MATNPVGDETHDPVGGLGIARKPSVRALFEARSVALVGASQRPGSVGETMLRQLRLGGFTGRIHPVNPKYDALDGLRCLPDLGALDESVDLAVLAVPDTALQAELERAASVGCDAAVIFGSPREAPSPTDRPDARTWAGRSEEELARGRAAGSAATVRERMRATADDAGMAVCGPNCMGFLDLPNRLRAVAYYEPFEREPGPVTFVSHSGSVFSAMLHNQRGTEFDLVVSAGEELTHTVADYVRYALERETTRVIALFLETVRDPEGFRAALALAAERDVPIVALTVGRTEVSRELVHAHSGAIAGDDAAYEALFDRYGVLRVRTLDELTDTVELLASGRRARPGGLAAVLDSGGERAHLLDVADWVGVRFADLSPRTTDRLAEVLEPGLPPVNPLDAWGTNSRFEHVYRESIRALLEDPDTGAFTLAVDITPEEDLALGYVPLLEEVAASTGLPVAVLGHVSSAVGRRQADRLRRSGIPVLEGTASGLRAFRALFEYRDARRRSAPDPPPAPHAVRADWKARLRDGEPLSEAGSLALLADYGLPVVPHHLVSTESAALAAADGLPWPVVLKTAAPGVTHKTELGGVRAGLRDEDDVRDAYRSIAARLGPDVIVSQQVGGVELTIGVVVDAQFGPLVLVGAGGVLVGLLRDRAVALAPIDEAWAARLLDRLQVRPVLDGFRGGPQADVGAVARAVATVSVLAADLADHLTAVDVNPLIAGPDGCVAVDALVVPRGPSPSG
jgi:acetate---CoA ligase (ADP-forming)